MSRRQFSTDVVCAYHFDLISKDYRSVSVLETNQAVTMTNWVSEAVLGCSKSIVWVETTDLVGQQTMRSDRIIDFLFFKYSNHV